MFTIASAIDGNWLWISITSYPWSFFAVCFLVLAFGFLVGMVVQYFRLYKRIKSNGYGSNELDACKKEMDELKDSNRCLQDSNKELQGMVDRFADEHDIDRFSPIQLRYMLQCLCEEETDFGRGLLLRNEDPIGNYLEEQGIFVCSPYEARDGLSYFSLDPGWRSFVRRNEDEIRNIAENGR